MKVQGWVLLLGMLAGCEARAPEPMSMSAAATANASSAPPPQSRGSAAPQSPQALATGEQQFGGELMPVPAPKGGVPERLPDGSLTPSDRRADDGSTKPSILAAVASPLKGEVADADIRAAVDSKADAMSRCLNADTVIEASLKVMPSGDITDVSITKSQPDEPIVRDCVASILRSARVQNVRGGQPTALSIKLVLRKSGLR